MALIKCKYCGHLVSDKAVKCPKCGGDLTQTEEPKQEVEVRETNTDKLSETSQLTHSDASQELYDDEPQQPKKGNGLKILLIILAVIAVGGIGYFLYWNNQQTELKAAIEAAQQDSIAAAQLLAAQEAARLDSIRQDSIKRVNFTSPDLAFHDLHGCVKQCNDLIFDEKGNWSNMPKAEWTEYELQYQPELQNMPIYERDKGKRIFRKNGVSDYEGIIHQEYEWSEGRISAIKTDSELGNVSLVYDDNGLLKTKRQESHGGEGWQYYVITYTYSDYKFDSYNNWIKRQVSTTQYTIDDVGNKTFGEEENFTESRTIEYY